MRDHMAARGGGEILLDIERRRGSVVSSLQARLRVAIRDGRLRLGEALPATRQLALELGISRASVVEAYARLAAEGFLESRPGSATRVAHGARSAIDGSRKLAARHAATYDLRPGGPDVSLFPWSAWARAAMTVARTAPEGVLQYGDPAGQPPLRAALAAYLGRTRAVVAHPDELVVTAGVTQSLALLCRILVRGGVRELGVEDPGPNTPERSLIRAAGMEPVPVRVDDEGIDVGALAASGVRAVLVTPAHHYPGGAVLSAARRRALVRWARDARRAGPADHRGRLRRGVPLRPPGGRRAPGPGAGPRRLPRLGQQAPRAGDPHRMGRRPRYARRRPCRGKGIRRLRLTHDRPAHPRRADRGRKPRAPCATGPARVSPAAGPCPCRDRAAPARVDGPRRRRRPAAPRHPVASNSRAPGRAPGMAARDLAGGPRRVSRPHRTPRRRPPDRPRDRLRDGPRVGHRDEHRHAGRDHRRRARRGGPRTWARPPASRPPLIHAAGCHMPP